MKKQINDRKPFEESLHGLIYDMFRRVGIGIGADKINSLRGVTRQIARTFIVESRLAAIMDLKALQTRIVGSFGIIGTSLDDIESRVKKLEEALSATSSKVVAEIVEYSDNKIGGEDGQATLQTEARPSGGSDSDSVQERRDSGEHSGSP